MSVDPTYSEISTGVSKRSRTTAHSGVIALNELKSIATDFKDMFRTALTTVTAPPVVTSNAGRATINIQAETRLNTEQRIAMLDIFEKDPTASAIYAHLEQPFSYDWVRHKLEKNVGFVFNSPDNLSSPNSYHTAHCRSALHRHLVLHHHQVSRRCRMPDHRHHHRVLHRRHTPDRRHRHQVFCRRRMLDR
ncbi:hypothetical protein A0H81_11509 [Grifola frondosa]|uniref:Uncharacterized protein n=1 Tax=Grifola frondosa TaxID=5627 RepID=A0A1C7LUT9_GRIFR|nr:hypothetical protein A0H81_11509 [Grifola frondosa]